MSNERRVGSTLVLYALVAVAFVASSIGLSRLVGSNEGVEHRFTIPAGTADRLAVGEAVEILPADLRFALRDTLVVVNNDSQTHTVGPFTVDPGQELVTRFSQAATFDGFCSLHPSGSVTISVSGT